MLWYIRYINYLAFMFVLDYFTLMFGLYVFTLMFIFAKYLFLGWVKIITWLTCYFVTPDPLSTFPPPIQVTLYRNILVKMLKYWMLFNMFVFFNVNDDKQLLNCLIIIILHIAYCTIQYLIFIRNSKVIGKQCCLPKHYICWWVFCNLCVCVYFCYVYKCSKIIFWSICIKFW